MLDTILRKNK